MGRKNLDRIKLYQEVLKAGRPIELELKGRSMFPFLLPGDKAKVRWIPLSRTKIGEIIVFRGNRETLISHRIIFKRGEEIITKGDFSPCCDRRWMKKDYLGRVEEVIGRRGIIFRVTQFFYPFPVLYSILVSLLFHPLFRLWYLIKRCLLKWYNLEIRGLR